MTLKQPDASALVAAALREDLGKGDVTSRWCVPRSTRARAALIARESGVAAGLGVFALAFRSLDASVKVRLLVGEGKRFRAGAVLARLEGPARPLLAAERVALNFSQRLCGIATLSAAYVAAARKGSPKARVLDTRKTTPLLRELEKYAVACGGAVNHRLRLDDAVLIKDNHIKAAGTVAEAVRRARASGLEVEVEVETSQELEEALASGADIILLDNHSPARARAAVERVRAFSKAAKRKVLTEASGGIVLKNVADYARAGVDRISVGALTHSPRALDLSLEFEVG